MEFDPQYRQQFTATTVGVLRRRGWTLLVLGGLAVTGSLIGVVAGLARQTLAGDDVVTIVVMLVFGSLFSWAGLKYLQVMRGENSQARVSGLTYAFAVLEAGVIFPDTGLQPTEVWPLSETRLSTGRSLGFATLRLDCPGKRPRSFLAQNLKLPVATIIEAVEREQTHDPEPSAAKPLLGRSLTIELADWARHVPVPRNLAAHQLRHSAVVTSIVCGLLSILFLVVALTDTRRPLDPASLVPPAILLGIAGLSWLASRVVVRTQRTALKTARALSGGPFAFTVSDGTILFPGGWGKNGEIWPLSETTLIYQDGGEPYLELTSPGKEPRQFPAAALQLSPDEVIDQVEAYRGTELR